MRPSWTTTNGLFNRLANPPTACGMSARIGDQTPPSMALLDHQFCYLDCSLDQQCLAATNHMEQHELCSCRLLESSALACLVTLLRSLWAGLERSPGVLLLTSLMGVALLSPRPETKSERTHCMDVPLAYKTLSGFHIGKWFHSARRTTGLKRNWCRSRRPIFLHNNVTRWTSKYFRDWFMYPSLHEQSYWRVQTKEQQRSTSIQKKRPWVMNGVMNGVTKWESRMESQNENQVRREIPESWIPGEHHAICSFTDAAL
jgi:hypothetical protein